MKVALELQPCCWTRSGIGTFTYEIARRLESNVDIEFYGNVFDPFWKKNENGDLSDIKMPIRQNKLLPYGAYRRLWNYIPFEYQKIFTPKVDLSVFFNFIVPPKISGKVITTVHDLTFLRYAETMKRSNYEHISSGLRRSVDRSDVIITVSEFTKRELQELMGVSADRIEVVYSAPSLHDNVSADFLSISSKYRIKSEYILFVGTIEPRKNLRRLIQAFDYLRVQRKIPEQLVLVGGDGWNNKEIYEELSHINHKDDVIFTGFVDGATKNALYKNANVFVFPSVYEGFGIPPLEAMQHGCPVVCANAASLPEVVGNAAYMVDPFDVNSIADGIYAVLSNNTLRRNLINSGYEQAIKYNWENTTTAFLDVIKRCNE